MKIFLLALTSLLLVVSCAAQRIDDNLAVFERAVDLASSVWTLNESASSDTVLRLHIRLHRPEQENLLQFAVDLATPGHSSYGQFPTREEVGELMRPEEASITAVESWLNEHNIGANDYSTALFGSQINLNITVRQAQELLNTNFHKFTSQDGPHTIVRALEYSLPTSLHQHIATIVPVVHLPQLRQHSSTIFRAVAATELPTSLAYDSEFCNSTITPACLQGLYQLNNYSAPLNQGTRIGVSGYLGQALREDDLHSFIAAFAPKVPQPFPKQVATYNSTVPDAQNAHTSDTIEASLDTQYVAALAPGIPISFISTSGLAPGYNLDNDYPDSTYIQNEPFMSQTEYIFHELHDDELPSVLTTSYGEDEQVVPSKYAIQVCADFAALGMIGVSVIFSSGDDGAGTACTKNDGSNAPWLTPTFPATCPYLTSVGGTVGVEPEMAAPFSGGGFSNTMPGHFFMRDAQHAYLDKIADKNAGQYNYSGRGFPDVAAQSVNVLVRDHGNIFAVSGTSASAPIFAGMIANLNALRKSQGLPNLGFLNPWIYRNASSAFTDIVHGTSLGCFGSSKHGNKQGHKIDGAGWPATEGWVAVTGFGTPDWPKLVKLALELEKPYGFESIPTSAWNQSETSSDALVG